MKNKIIIMCALAFVMASCVKTKVYQVNDASRDWFADTTNLSFTMMDENDINQSFRFDAAHSYTTKRALLSFSSLQTKVNMNTLTRAGQTPTAR